MQTDITRLRKAIGSHIRQHRKAQDLSQSQACRQAGLSIDTWSRLERGVEQNTTLGTFVRVADTLGVEISALFPSRKSMELSPAMQRLVEFLEPVDAEALNALRKALSGVKES